MKLLERIFGKRETRADTSWEALSTLPVSVQSRAAENLSTVMACVSAISGTISSLPANVYRRQERGRVIDWDHPVQRLIDRGPNDHQTWADFVEWLLASCLLRGNAVCEVVRDSRGAPIQLVPHGWSYVTVHRLGSGRLAYDITDMNRSGRIRRLLEDEVLHLRDRSDDGLIGISRLTRAREVVEANQTLQEFSKRIYTNGVAPSGVVEADEAIGPDQIKALSKRFREAFAGPGKAGTALVLDQGLKWRQLGVSPEDAELLASRRFSVEELARLFSVPPVIVGDLSHGSYNNVHALTRYYAQHTLAPWIRKVEQVFKRDVFAESSRATHEISFDLSALLRGDPEQRWQAHAIAVQNGILDPDEVRQVEGWNPRESAQRSEQRSLDDLSDAQRRSLERRLAIREAHRPRIREALAPIIRDDAEAVLRALETDDLAGLLEQFERRGGDEGDVANALRDEALAMESEVREVIQDETGQRVDDAVPFTSAMLGAVGTGYALANRAQAETLWNQPDALRERTEQWLESRADDMAIKVSVRVESGASHRLYRKAGRSRGRVVDPQGENLEGSLHEPFAEADGDLETDLNNPPLAPGDDRVLVAD